MGQKLIEYYKETEKLYGRLGRARLAQLTGIPSLLTDQILDSAENLELFNSAMKKLKNENLKNTALPETENELKTSVPGESKEVILERRKRQISAMAGLLMNRNSIIKQGERAFPKLTETAANALNVDRASIWLLDEQKTMITCLDLFERQVNKHSSGIQLKKTDFPTYFEAMLKEKTIAAHDAHTDPRTTCFSAPYLTPLKIVSMLDVPIWVEHKFRGVLCHEHIGSKRTWLAEEENVAYSLGGYFAQALAAEAK